MPTTPPPPYLTGDHVQILYKSPRGTVLADAEVTVVYPHDDEHWEIVAVLSGPRGEFALVPAPPPEPPVWPSPGPHPPRQAPHRPLPDAAHRSRYRLR